MPTLQSRAHKAACYSPASPPQPTSYSGKAVDKTYDDWRDASYNGGELPIGIITANANILWVAMPTFDPNEKVRAAYAALSTQLQEKSKTARAVVLDLRHNQGGSSQWSLDVAAQIWGKTAVQARKKISQRQGANLVASDG